MPIDSSRPEPGPRVAQGAAQLAQARECPARLLGVGDLAADRHEAPDVEPTQARKRVDGPGEIVRPEPRLGRVEVHVHLEEDRHAFHAELTGQPVEPRREPDRVHRLDHRECLERPACLVRLQRPDEVPAGARHLGDLREGLLDPVLAEQAETRIDGMAQPRRRHGLGDRDERHRPRVAPGPRAGIGDALEHARVRGTERLDLV